jgi:MYXO-CTERM domain-containing protein
MAGTQLGVAARFGRRDVRTDEAAHPPLGPRRSAQIDSAGAGCQFIRQNESPVSSRNLRLSSANIMRRVPHLSGVLLLTVAGFAQPPDTGSNPDTSTGDAYNRPVPMENGSSHGNWGLLGLLGLTGLLGRRRRETTVHTLDEFSTDQRRRAS